MGTDHDARKRSKKTRKGAFAIDKELASEGRRKRPKKRKLSPEDLEGEQAPAKLPMLFQGNKKKQKMDEETATRSSTASQRKRPRFTTSVNLDGVSGPEAKDRRQPVAEAARAPEDLDKHPAPVRRFLQQQGFTELTPIQEMCWRPLYKGRDVIGVSEPSSGKTLAYLLPLAARFSPVDAGPTVGLRLLVLLPTRETASQVATVSRTLKPVFGLRTICIYGGGEGDARLQALEEAPHIVVATPGRLLELLKSSSLPAGVGGCRAMVLDEADRMLDLGLRDQVQAVRSFLLQGGPSPQPDHPPPALQVALFTATMPSDVTDFARSWLTRPKLIRAASAGNVSPSIVQVVQVCAEPKKPVKLLKHLANIKERAAGQRNLPRILVFANKIKTVRFLHETVQEAGYRVVMLHGERSQHEREEALQAFKAGKVQIMVATDVAARGLHIRNLPYVVNYDFPSRLETYIHRVGRTGRLSASGHAFSFLTRNLAPLAGPLVTFLQAHGESVDPNLVRLAEAYQQAQACLQAGPQQVAAAHPSPSGHMPVEDSALPPASTSRKRSKAEASAGDGGLPAGDGGLPAGDGGPSARNTNQMERSWEAGERRSKEDLSEDDDAILKRMFADPKKRLSKHELPGLYKKAGAAAGGEAGRFLTRPPSKDVAPAPRALKRKALPGRLRKKLASQAERGP